jgi:hypothetical protein
MGAALNRTWRAAHPPAIESILPFHVPARPGEPPQDVPTNPDRRMACGIEPFWRPMNDSPP